MPASPEPFLSRYQDNPSGNHEFYDDPSSPHGLSGAHNPSPYQGSTNSLPLNHSPPDTSSRGSYIPAAASSTAQLPAMSRNYTNIDTGRGRPAESEWLEKQTRSGRRSKYIVIGTLVTLLCLIAAGVAIGVTVSKKHHSTSNDVATSDPNSGVNTSIVKQSDPNDPSTFQKDSRLIRSFYGLAYTPANSQIPNCGNSLADIIQDIQIMSQLTTRIRLYGADCNQSALVLEAIKQTKVNMTVYLANYPVATDNNTAYNRQRDALKSAIQTYGTDHIAGVTVGNEFILNYLNDNGGGDNPNSAVGNAGAAILISDITDTKSMLQGLSVNLPVGNSDAGSYFNNEVLEAVSYGMANVHPWFANVSVDQAAGWTWNFFESTDVTPAANLSSNPQMSIAETGWPTNSTDAGNMNNGASLANEANLQKYLNTFVCQANQNNTEYFYFETFDEPWKTVQFGGVEGYWGMFYSNKTLKNIQIPNCPLS